MEDGRIRTLKAVFHINEREKLALAIQNVQNLLTYYAQREIENRTEIVVNGQAVLALVRGEGEETGDGAAMAELSAQGVRIAACGNALRGRDIDPTRLYPFVRVVPAGVAELVVRQAEGYAYIKP
jgi:intracellular sulfur oxidation DsrE/DsrF family protein